MIDIDSFSTTFQFTQYSDERCIEPLSRIGLDWDGGNNRRLVVVRGVPPVIWTMYRSLSSLVPNAADLLALEVEELAGVLLIHLNSYEGVSGNSIFSMAASAITISSIPSLRAARSINRSTGKSSRK